VEALAERRIDVVCVQETRWRGSGCRFFGAIGKRYKLSWMGSKAKTDGVGIFVAEKWVDSVVSVEWNSERVLVLKMVLGDCLLNVFTVYAPHSGKPDEEKESFWNKVFHLVSCIPQNEMVVFAADMNGHIGSRNVGYEGTHGGFGYGSRNADGSRILEFADGLNRLHWYGHVLRKADDDWVKKCMEYEVEGPRPRGRPKRTWREVV